MGDLISDALIDTLKLIPFLFLTFLLLEYIEHKLSKRKQEVFIKYKKIGPVFGGIMGGFPQCGFSSMASNLYSANVITMGTLIAIFLSTSDEMLPIMLAKKVELLTIIKIIGFKILIGIIVGAIVDLVVKNKDNNNYIEEMCHDDNCHCEGNLIISSIRHTIKIATFILIFNLIINIIIYYLGSDNISNLIQNKNIIVYFVSSLIGLIPNCAASIIITEVYLSGLSTIGVALAGLLTGSGLGILLLFRSNKNIKENMAILSIVYFTGVIVGIIVDLII